MLKFILFIIFISIFVLRQATASCYKMEEDGITNIYCEIDQTATHFMGAFNEKNSITNIIPKYDSNDIYATLEINGIRTYVDGHILNIGLQDRIDVTLNLLDNVAGDQIINLYGQDNLSNMSALKINKLLNKHGDITINGENKNSVEINESFIYGNLYVNNINLSLKTMNVVDINLTSSLLTLQKDGEASISNINLSNKSTLIINSSAEIDSITSQHSNTNINIFGKDIAVSINDIFSLGALTIENNSYLEGTNLQVSSLQIFDTPTLDVYNLQVEKLEIFNNTLLSPTIIAKESIHTKILDINDTTLNINAGLISVESKFLIDDSKVNVDGNINASTMEVKNSRIISKDSLVVSHLTTNYSLLTFENVNVENSLTLNSSLIKADDFYFSSFDPNGSSLHIVLNDTMSAQGNLSSGIYVNNDIHILGDVDIVLSFANTSKIRDNSNIIYEVLYAKDGEINYEKGFYIFDNNIQDFLEIDLYTIVDQGTSLVAEVNRILSYCEALNSHGISCSHNNDFSFSQHSFIQDVSKLLDNFIQSDNNNINISNLINGLDKQGLDSLVSNISSLRPISNDMLFITKNIYNTKLSEIHYQSQQDNSLLFYALGGLGSVKDNIFLNDSSLEMMSIYYGIPLYKDIYWGISIGKLYIDNKFYKVDDLDLSTILSYQLQISSFRINLLTLYGIDILNKKKSNFQNDISTNNLITSRGSFSLGIDKIYELNNISINYGLFNNINYMYLPEHQDNGSGYLYVYHSSYSMTNKVGANVYFFFNITSKLLLEGSTRLFYNHYKTDNTNVIPCEISSNHVEFENNIYSGIGQDLRFLLKYQVNDKMKISSSYSFEIARTYHINSISFSFQYDI